MADIFISYKKEHVDDARLLAAVLEESGWSVFWDRNIPPGGQFADVLREELEAAKCVLVLWSELSVASRWVREEAQFAAKREVLVPIFIEDVEPPLGFGTYEGAQLFDWEGEADHEEFQSLHQAIEQRISGRGIQP